MKKLTAILQGCQFESDLFELREKEIVRKLEAVKDECEELKIKSRIDYERAMQRLGGERVDYGAVLNDMVKAKASIKQADLTLEIIKDIEKDLNSDVKFPSTKADNE